MTHTLTPAWHGVLVALTCAISIAGADPAMDMLNAGPKPSFRAGHTLPPLTRWGWEMPFDVRVELTEHWGYALEFGGYLTEGLVAELDKPDSIQSKLVALTNSDPQTYPLGVLIPHGQFGDLPDTAWTHDADGNLPEGKKIWSPEAPTEIFEQAGKAWAEPLRKLRAKAPVAMVLNGGEYALSVYGHHGEYWAKDPKVMAAKGDLGWFDYISASKARQEIVISEALREAAPDRTLYLYYYTDGCPHANRYGGWWTWAWDYSNMRPISDIPNGSIYYKHYNSGWTGDNDMLTQTLNSVAQQLVFGDALSYNWLNAGWTREGMGDAAHGDQQHYMGYLKCYYTAGMIGGVAGYFAYPVATSPECIGQMMTLGHAHAFFSHLEDIIREGDLLPGPNKHVWTKALPAYEFPTGDPDARVVVRKHRQKPEWLLTAWAAGGDDREVTVTVPELGEVKLLARACGSVYRGTLDEGQAKLKLLDEDGMAPSRGWNG